MLNGSSWTDLVFQNGNDYSNTIILPNRDIILRIYSPAALDGTVKVYSTVDNDATHQLLKSSGSDIEIPVSSVVTIKHLAGDKIRLKSSVVQTAIRTFKTRIIQEL